MKKETSRLIREYNREWQESNSIYEKWAKSKGLTFTAFLVVLSLTEEGAVCTQNSIATNWQIPKQSVNSVLSSFVKDGLVTLSECEADRRSKNIELTEKGRAVLLPITNEITDIENRAAEEMGADRLSLLLEYTRLLNSYIEKEIRK